MGLVTSPSESFQDIEDLCDHPICRGLPSDDVDLRSHTEGLAGVVIVSESSRASPRERKKKPNLAEPPSRTW